MGQVEEGEADTDVGPEAEGSGDDGEGLDHAKADGIEVDVEGVCATGQDDDERNDLDYLRAAGSLVSLWAIFASIRDGETEGDSREPKA